jgi:protein lifeguard
MGKGDHRDLESGVLLPAGAYMIESPQLRWAFIRKVYALVAMQLLATAAAAAAVYFVPAIRRFFAARTPAAVAAFVAIILAPIIREHLSIPDRPINPIMLVHLRRLFVRAFR